MSLHTGWWRLRVWGDADVPHKWCWWQNSGEKSDTWPCCQRIVDSIDLLSQWNKPKGITNNLNNCPALPDKVYSGKLLNNNFHPGHTKSSLRLNVWWYGCRRLVIYKLSQNKLYHQYRPSIRPSFHVSLFFSNLPIVTSVWAVTFSLALISSQTTLDRSWPSSADFIISNIDMDTSSDILMRLSTSRWRWFEFFSDI